MQILKETKNCSIWPNYPFFVFCCCKLLKDDKSYPILCLSPSCIIHILPQASFAQEDVILNALNLVVGQVKGGQGVVGGQDVDRLQQVGAEVEAGQAGQGRKMVAQLRDTVVRYRQPG